MEEAGFEQWLASELAGLPGVLAVSLGGSRAAGTGRPDSDWDFAVYYRRSFDPGSLRDKGWPGEISDIGGWGGGVMNGGAWLTVEGRRVDVHYRDLDDVDHWCREAEAGRFKKELLLFYIAGIPTYVVMAELATHRVLAGELPRPGYPDLLAREAGRRWGKDAIASLGYAAGALAGRGDLTVAFANASRGLLESAHSVLASRREWALNEKGLVEKAALGTHAQLLLGANNQKELAAAISDIAGHVSSAVPL